MSLALQISLRSDASFGRGEGVAGLVDAEIEYDLATGLPFVRGRTLKGLLVEECANILFTLEQNQKADAFTAAAQALFGRPGSQLDDEAIMQIGPAALPDDLQKAVRKEIADGRMTANDILRAFTGIRRQTAVDEGSGAPKEGSLRAMRVLLRDTQLTAPLYFKRAPDAAETALLSACARSVRRAGMGRTRGSGRISVALHENGQDVTGSKLAQFRQLTKGGAA